MQHQPIWRGGRPLPSVGGLLMIVSASGWSGRRPRRMRAAGNLDWRGTAGVVRGAMGRQWAKPAPFRSERLTMPANHALLHIGGCSAAVAAPAAATAVAEP